MTLEGELKRRELAVGKKSASPGTAHMKGAADIVAKAFDSGNPVYVSFSGGKDSLALLKLCEPYLGRFKLVWANTGYTFPHVEQRIREEGDRFGLIELKPDLHANWKAKGWPSELMTVGSAISSKEDIRLQPWALCCAAMKALPIVEWLAKQQGSVILMNGQRVEDGWRSRSPYPYPDNTVGLAPLYDWTTEDVLAFLDAEGVELPSHYRELMDSLDCWICPAHWSMKTAPAYSRFLRREYPEFAETVLPTVRKIYDHAEKATARMWEAVLDGSA